MNEKHYKCSCIKCIEKKLRHRAYMKTYMQSYRKLPNHPVKEWKPKIISYRNYNKPLEKTNKYILEKRAGDYLVEFN